MTKNVKYQRTNVLLNTLQLHPILKIIGIEPVNKLLSAFYDEFNYLEIPVITEDGCVITHGRDFNFAKENNFDKIDVVIIKNVDKDDIIKFIQYDQIVNHGKNKKKMFEVVEFLNHHLTKNPKGKIFRKHFTDMGIHKTRAMVACILGVSDGTIGSLQKIGRNNPEQLEKIDSGNAKLVNTYQVLNKQKIEKNYSNSIKKRFIQELIFQLCGGLNSDALVLLGPQPLEYIDTLKKNILLGNNNIYSFERDEKSFRSQNEIIVSNKINNVFTAWGEIIKATPKRFIDLDLMCKWESAKPTIFKLFSTQYDMNTSKRKVFNFSFSYLFKENKDLNNWFKNELSLLLECNIEMQEKIPLLHNSCKFKLRVDNPDYEVHAFYYSDTSPMMSLTIQYY